MRSLVGLGCGLLAKASAVLGEGARSPPEALSLLRMLVLSAGHPKRQVCEVRCERETGWEGSEESWSGMGCWRNGEEWVVGSVDIKGEVRSMSGVRREGEGVRERGDCGLSAWEGGEGAPISRLRCGGGEVSLPRPKSGGEQHGPLESSPARSGCVGGYPPLSTPRLPRKRNPHKTRIPE